MTRNSQVEQIASAVHSEAGHSILAFFSRGLWRLRHFERFFDVLRRLFTSSPFRCDPVRTGAKSCERMLDSVSSAMATQLRIDVIGVMRLGHGWVPVSVPSQDWLTQSKQGAKPNLSPPRAVALTRARNAAACGPHQDTTGIIEAPIAGAAKDFQPILQLFLVTSGGRAPLPDD
jgi:hypothetical protein